LLITADDKARLYGEANPVLTYSVGSRDLVNNDTLTGTLDVAAGPTSVPGPYQIRQATLAASPNYSLSYVPGTLVVGSSQVVPSNLIAGALVRDAFSTDTRPATDAAILVDGDGASGGAALLVSPSRETPAFCPKEQACPTADRGSPIN